MELLCSLGFSCFGGLGGGCLTFLPGGLKKEGGVNKMREVTEGSGGGN